MIVARLITVMSEPRVYSQLLCLALLLSHENASRPCCMLSPVLEREDSAGRIEVGCGKKICDSVCGGNFEYLDRMRALRMQPRAQFVA
jgi:hypothetical protein